MEADLIKLNDKKRSLYENDEFSTNFDSFSIANIETKDSSVKVNESQTSFVGTLETEKDTAWIFSETRSAIKKKVKFRKRTEQFDSLDGSDQIHPEKVVHTNTDQTDIDSGLTQSDEGNSEEKIDSFNVNETK
ncbi:hypothetical protein HRI_003907000 [Hibiscus trionum]|uniref:Uncharacterized protein n=1 Tax=Hibiscus trionum TaxID=183268 RepID=A0A9W7MFP0_HIBTR|nr:hypothetical protein HRI_003907000 [Hibiscus trionum]